MRLGILFLILLTPSFQGTERLFDAVRDGDATEVRGLLSAGVDVNATDTTGRTALMLAAEEDDETMVGLLLEAGADPTKRTPDGVSALTIAKAEASRGVVDLLRNAGARESPEELLDEAIRRGDLEAVAELIEQGVDVDALDTDDYQTPLMTALELRELEIFLRLVEAGADPTREGTGIATTGENAITLAARQGSPWALRQLFESSSRPRQEDLDRALLLGCDNAAVARVAVEAGANVDARGVNGQTPLICAASAGAADAVSVMLEAGANVDATTDDGRTASEWAELNGFEEVVALLER